jgi:tetratricopeptide (TPR) repeat protein
VTSLSRFRQALGAALLLTALGAAGCMRKTADCDESQAGAVVDPALLAFLSRAKSAHHRADLHEAARDTAKAAAALEELVNGPMPRPAEPPPEVREVLADSHARLSDLKSQLGDFDSASRQIELGLKRVPERNYFRGHLFEMRGLVEERHARELRQRGQAEQAAGAEQRALEAYEESMRIQSEAIQRALPGDR